MSDTGEWGRLAAWLARSVERRVDETRSRVFGNRQARQVVPYPGFGTATEVFLTGRVLAGRAVSAPDERDRWWRNLGSTLRHLESGEVAGARVRIRALGAEREVLTDDEGYYRAWLTPAAGTTGGSAWHDADVEVIEPVSSAVADVRETGRILVPPGTAQFGVISDLDDTVIRTDATRLLRMLKQTLFENARTRLPFAGVAAFYAALHAGSSGAAGNPVFYVSSSPWNLYPLLAGFLEHHGIPAGPMMLRDWGISEQGLLPPGHGRHKLAAIRQILETYPGLPFILVGDSGQEDPEIYRDVVHDHGLRIPAVYIRDVSRNAVRSSAIAALSEEVRSKGSILLLADETLPAARHAAARGWIRPDAVHDVERAVNSWEERPR
jgi:phosphatidate phosphatase APP1